MAARPTLYTIPPSAPFLSALARAILNGDLPHPGGNKPDPLTLPDTTIYLPTRRAARALREAFLEVSGGEALLLPRIKALGDPDEDEAIILATDAGLDPDAATGAVAIGAMERRFALTRMILAWRGIPPGGLIEVDPAAGRFEVTPTQGANLAADLARLMDTIETEEADLSALETLVPDDFAGYWQTTIEFLKIVTDAWPAYLRDRLLVSPAARRNALMAMEAERLAGSPPRGPVIAAGSTGTVPATARLLQVIASLPDGAVVLPGLDKSLDDASWDLVAKHPEHPQAGMAELLRKLGAMRDDVAYVPGSAPDRRAASRLTLVSEVLRPAGSTELWQDFLEPPPVKPQLDLFAEPSGGSGDEASSLGALETALAGIQCLEAPTAQDEAEAIALIMRSSIETEGRTAALITPDRALARRVAASLAGYGLSIDDSAGLPVSRTVPGAFLDLVLDAAASNFAPPRLMALLKHPLTLLGRTPAGIRSAARALERHAFRDIYVGQGLEGARVALATETERTRRRPSTFEREQPVALRLVASLEATFAPLTKLFAGPSPHSVAELAEAHSEVAEALARDADGSPAGLWQGDAGEALSVLLAELIGEGGAIRIAPANYPPFYRSLLAGQMVRPRGPAHPRLFIWGPLEARLQQPDVVILGSLNEGVWPRPQEAGPWLSRPMREALGLSSPERRIGLAAHDFAQALGARHVYLTRALKVEGVPTVASRWLQRLNALVRASGLDAAIAPKEPWIAWARDRDHVPTFEPVKPPRPCPPVEARPRELGATRIERWIANPYEIFARGILKLYKLEPLGEEPGPALRGQIVHRVLHDFAVAHPDKLPNDIAGELVRLADKHFAALHGSPRIEAFWRPQFQRFAEWFAATEPARRGGVVKVHSEVDGALDIPVGTGFRLTARADRIDVRDDGEAAIYDYKTGAPPKAKHVDDLFAPQLPLEAAILEGGGFAAIGKRTAHRLTYVHASGRQDGGAEADMSVNASIVLAALTALVERFDRTDTPYEVKRRAVNALQRAYRYDDYAQLARLQEWATVGGEEEIP